MAGKRSKFVGVVVAASAALALILLAPSVAGAYVPPCPDYTEPAEAAFTFTPMNPYTGQAVEFDGSGSIEAVTVHESYNFTSEECEPTGTTPHPITSYEWDFGDGHTETTSSPETVHHFTSQGPYQVTLEVVSGTPPSVPDTQQVVVVAPALPSCTPVTSKSTAANTAVEMTLSCSVPPESAPATYYIETNPSHGTLSGLNTTTGTVTYTPDAGFTGTDLFGYRATNEAGSTAATVSVTVNPPPAPVCQAVSVSAAGVPVQITLNCSTTATGFANTYSIVANPSHGTLSGLDAAAGTVTYTPNAGYSGPDSFTYTAANAGGTGNTATVSITVTAKPSGGGGGALPSAEVGGKCTDSSFTFGRVKLNRRKGTATLPVNVRCKGSLKLTGKGVKTFSATAQTAGSTVKLKVVPKGKKKRILEATGKVKVKVFVTFDPTAAGNSSTASKKIKLRKS